MATSKKALGFAVLCPHCHDEDSIISLNLNDLGEVTCSACDTTFSASTARDLAAAELAKWEKVVRWVEMARDLVE